MDLVLSGGGGDLVVDLREARRFFGESTTWKEEPSSAVSASITSMTSYGRSASAIGENLLLVGTVGRLGQGQSVVVVTSLWRWSRQEPEKLQDQSDIQVTSSWEKSRQGPEEKQWRRKV